MSGIANLKPPKPKYSFTWDVEKVLQLFRFWPTTLTAKQLTEKTATLLGLIAIPRGAELHQLDLRFLDKYADRYVFNLAGLVKNQHGKKPNPLMFFKHAEEPLLCPVACIEKYKELTSPWRTEGLPSEFFLRYISSHKPISISRLAGWIKEALRQADIDTGSFQAHSIRGASSSKAFTKVLSAKEVVERGSFQRVHLATFLPQRDKGAGQEVPRGCLGALNEGW